MGHDLQDASHAGVQVSGFCELTLESDDPAQLAGFYRDCFGLPELSHDGECVWLAVGENARLGLWRPGVKQFGDQGGAHVHFAFSLAPGSLDRVAERLRAGAAEVEGPVEHDGGDRSLYVRDPEGNLVEAWDHFCRGRSVQDLDGCGTGVRDHRRTRPFGGVMSRQVLSCSETGQHPAQMDSPRMSPHPVAASHEDPVPVPVPGC